MKTAVVVTSISAPNPALKLIAAGCRERGHEFLVIGDVASPAEFQIDGADFYGLDRQKGIGSRVADLCPIKSYARKNIGYLLAVKYGAELILETDDDNFPRFGFWQPRALGQDAPLARNRGWVNAYRYFGYTNIWPRGFPLDIVSSDVEAHKELERAALPCPIQQGLVDESPDVDAIYRLLFPGPASFPLVNRRVIFGRGSWCPFNSQNTAWFPQAFPLLYLPAYCSIRMTDIWRSFIAQRICWENGWGVLFHGPTAYQTRNPHNLLRDFRDEIPGYLHNREIAEALEALPLQSGEAHLGDNLQRCYDKLIRMNLVGEAELPLLQAWLEDIKC